MEHNKKYVDSFKYGLLFGKQVEPGKEVSISVTDKADILLAIKKAYIDMSPRTFESADSEDKRAISYKGKTDLFDALADKFLKYMNNGPSDFDKWHNEICVYFIKKLKELLRDAGKKEGQATYGKAQKIINMTFKYLYCYDDAAEHIEKFEPCHMALDSYILNWYREKYNENNDKHLTKTGKNSLPAWSNLDYEQYISIQKNIRGYCERIPIEEEFLIWYQQKESK